ncbi:MAG: hypothetical protein GY832_39240 [Chloroflexi bacterium]|nr:hypothetical protein [Chloroflexota bacterium]
MKKHTGTILISVGVLFLINAILGRYLVLPGYLASLEAGSAAIEQAQQAVPVWKIVRYLVWAYSFKLGIFFAVIGASVNASMHPSRFRWFVVGGILYLAFAYVPLPAHSLAFGIGGGLTTILMLLIIKHWMDERQHLTGNAKTASGLRMIGYFFFVMATYTLCPLMGVKAFALHPEKMIAYGLQGEAASFASHLLIELVLGWFFTFLSYRKSDHLSSAV